MEENEGDGQRKRPSLKRKRERHYEGSDDKTEKRKSSNVEEEEEEEEEGEEEEDRAQPEPQPKRRRLWDYAKKVISTIKEEVRPSKTIEDLQVGDHIYVWRMCTYKHHGVYIGNRQVIHFTGDSIERARVVLVENAQRLEGLFQGEYDLFCFNCEHVATWCKTGRLLSHQVNKYVPLLQSVVWRQEWQERLWRMYVQRYRDVLSNTINCSLTMKKCAS
ncbi:Lecithin retinol acyltransferase [Balamuthia mandrillaris]